MSDQLKAILAIIAEYSGKSLEKVQTNPLFADIGMDSLDIVELVMGIEDKFNVEIPDQDWADFTDQPVYVFIDAIEKAIAKASNVV